MTVIFPRYIQTHCHSPKVNLRKETSERMDLKYYKNLACTVTYLNIFTNVLIISADHSAGKPQKGDIFDVSFLFGTSYIKFKISRQKSSYCKT